MLAIGVALLCWSAVCALTFALAHAWRSFDYHAFFARLLGLFAFVFEIAYFLFMVLILAVFGAAAGEIGLADVRLAQAGRNAAAGAGDWCFPAFGNRSVEALFGGCRSSSTASTHCSACWCCCALAITPPPTLATPQATDGWLVGGLTCAGYNIVGAVISCRWRVIS